MAKGNGKAKRGDNIGSPLTADEFDRHVMAMWKPIKEEVERLRVDAEILLLECIAIETQQISANAALIECRNLQLKKIALIREGLQGMRDEVHNLPSPLPDTKDEAEIGQAKD